MAEMNLASGPPQEQSAVLIMNRQPRRILKKYSPDQVRQLYEFLHNGNPQYRYVFGFRRKAEPIYKHADRFKRLPVSKSIDWAIRTLGGIGQIERRHCYVPLPNNPSGHSRWGGLDFDAHNEGELARASDLAIRAFLHVVDEPLFTVLETSGVGFKLWMIANEFRAVSWWATFLEGIVCAIGARPQSGVVELFPSRDPKKYGCGAGSIWLFNHLGAEFVPKLDEGSITAMLYKPVGMSMEDSLQTDLDVENRLRAEFPEITRVFSRIGNE
jgi:hypothetical protein